MTQFKSTFGITTFALAIIFLFNSFLAFLFIALVGVLIYPKTSQYIKQKYKLNRTLKNTIIVFLFPIGFILGMYHSIIAFDKMIPQQKESNLNMDISSQVQGEFENNDDRKRMQQVLDSINLVLESKKLNLCEEIRKISNIELSCIREADKAYPNFDYPKHGNYTEKCIKNKIEEYKKEQGVSEDLYSKEPPLKTVALDFRLDPKGHTTHFES